MRAFYKKLLADKSINFYFTKITNIDQNLESHFEILATFWEQSLFIKGSYSNNMFRIHKALPEKHAFTKEHYDTWLSYFYTIVDTYFKGKNAKQMKTTTLNMAAVMQIKFQ